MKKTALLFTFLLFISFVAYSQNSNFTAEDFKNHIGKKVVFIYKNSPSSTGERYIKEAGERYIVCSLRKNSDDDLLIVLYDQIAAFRIKQDEAEAKDKKKE